MLEDYSFVVVSEGNGEGYTIIFPDLPGCMTVAGDLNEIPHMVASAFHGWSESMQNMGIVMPKPANGDRVLEYIHSWEKDNDAQP